MALVWLVVVLLVAVPSASAAPVQLLPASGAPGTHTTLVASELTPRSEIELRVGKGGVKRLRANSAGIVTARELIPSTARGQIPVSVTDARGDRALLRYDVRSRWAQAASFAGADWRGRVADVAADLRLGRLVVVADVRGLLPDARVAARFGGRRVARAIAGPRGHATLRAVLPQEAAGRQLVVKGRRLRLTSTLPTPPATAVVAADIACKAPYETYEDHCQHGEVAELAGSLDPDVIVIPGDIQYNDGTLSEFRRSFHPTWGQLESAAAAGTGEPRVQEAGSRGLLRLLRDAVRLAAAAVVRVQRRELALHLAELELRGGTRRLRP